MQWAEKYEQLLPKFKAHNNTALAKMISLLEDNYSQTWEIISRLHSDIQSKNSYVIGVTGSPGVGKSSFISRLVSFYSNKGQNIGIILIDPSSPFSGGAFLGDRVRMFDLTNASNVYIRSIASRGAMGGVCNSIYDIIDVMKAFGFDTIIIETVGTGQSEIDIFYACDTTLLILSPDSGDEIQIYKAGIMEIADCYIVNKIDLPNSKRFLMYLENYLDSRNEDHKKVFGVSSIENKGFEKVYEWLESNREYFQNLNLKENLRKKSRVKNYLFHLIENYLEGYSLENQDADSLKKDVITFICEEEGNDGAKN
ncbi:transporter [Petrotoga sp. 9T1HF07.CasAA.8.2]|uniref:methylmalonyl Co-A mutase-associated GTPase MeaB n=1 Tax=Petrotoga sp. 9T1HF07.CasAA.8.2 TaxID=1434329 RepID=UPI000CC44A77|nr:methylmalonyl Co-A mutase-associated GTPase MeaB [Petrotoga sp. 9T1HF07.CasAA.8.2]PNR87356.1 transporter [Petrotoga sp. 9T1HF07.CasAA.8.2]